MCVCINYVNKIANIMSVKSNVTQFDVCVLITTTLIY